MASPPAPTASRGRATGPGHSVAGRVNAPARRAAVRRPAAPIHRAIVRPVASVPSCGWSPASPTACAGPSRPPVVIRHRSPRLPRQRTVTRPVPGWSASAGRGRTREVPTVAGAVQRPAAQRLSRTVPPRAKSTAPWPASSTATVGPLVTWPAGPSGITRAGGAPPAPIATNACWLASKPWTPPSSAAPSAPIAALRKTASAGAPSPVTGLGAPKPAAAAPAAPGAAETTAQATARRAVMPKASEVERMDAVPGTVPPQSGSARPPCAWWGCAGHASRAVAGHDRPRVWAERLSASPRAGGRPDSSA